METTEFYPRTWNDIEYPKRSEPSLLIVRQQNQIYDPNPDHNEQVLVLLMDDPENKYDRVTSLGYFWKLSVARQFCKSFTL